jgi:hypothetical protein
VDRWVRAKRIDERTFIACSMSLTSFPQGVMVTLRDERRSDLTRRAGPGAFSRGAKKV